MTKKISKPLLVTGTMRTGTKWTTQALRANDVDVRHEWMGDDGTVSWFFSIDARSPYDAPGTSMHTHGHRGEGRCSDYEFGTIMHLVRNPLKVIGSMVSIMLTIEQEWLVKNGVVQPDTKPKLLRMMQAWEGINAEVERVADYRVRLEDWTMQQKLWDKLGRRLGRKLTLPALPVKNASRGIFKAKIITVQDLKDCDATLAKAIVKRAQRYGYIL